MTSGLKKLMTALAFAGLSTACASVAPSQLVEARTAYEASNQGLTAKLTPSDVYDAKKALDQANNEFEQNGDTLICRDYAYIAHRKFQLADAKARTELARQNVAKAVKAGVVVRDTQVKDTQAALASTREQLKDERRDSTEQGKALQQSTADLETEKQARLAAEGKLAGALKDLATVAAVKEEARGVVITLSGSVLFASGKYALLNTAMTKLDQVAEALKTLDSGKRIVVEGHTDSQGSDSTNQPLSVNRATSVRDYLVSRGVGADKISAIGMGASKPIADNKTAEDRANNRRVEIVIGAATLSAR